jgi:crotonobetainyl-CoA:carnitine CoA-transferase CaiB-like acyl-CoA transferase
MRTDSFAPLSGLAVLDASRVLAGPFCGQILGDLGADVVKVERPGAGDETRAWGPPFLGDLSAYYLSCNRNKRAITLDIASEEGRKIFLQLVERADVLLENFRASSLDHLDLSAQKLLAASPSLIVCSISGFGRSGPLRDRPGYDFAIQALSGLMAITGPAEGPPSKVGVAVVDVLTGLYSACAILACLRAREKSGHGYVIDMALLGCAFAAQVNVAQAFLTGKEVPPRQGNAHLQIVPYQLFQTADSWLVLAVGNDEQWQRFCEAAGFTDLAADPRFLKNPSRVEHRDVLVPMLAERMKLRSTKAWQALLEEAEVPSAPVWTYADLLADPASGARGLAITVRDPDGKPAELVAPPFRIEGTALPEARIPPRLGEHTADVLRDWLAMDERQSAELHRKGVV